tara:strand:+ start:3642 stop:4427 length:786 start_codon:yes stop_codon:yes gene_type:complete
MSLEDLKTDMRELSSNYQDNSLVKTYLSEEIVKLRNKESDIISYLCMPGIRVMEPIPTAWYNSLIVGKQWSNPNDLATFLYDGDSGWFYSKSNFAPDPQVPSNTLDMWTIKKWKRWEYTSGSGGAGGTKTWQRVKNDSGVPEDVLVDTITYSNLTDAKLTELGFAGMTKEDDITPYIDQWNFGMEWLHGRPSVFSGDGEKIGPVNNSLGIPGCDGSNPYADSIRAFGIKDQIESHLLGMTSQDTNVAFYANASTKWDQILP